MMPMWNGWWPLGMALSVAFWALVVALIVLVVRRALQQGRAARSGIGGDAPLKILKRRYASGEIDRDEFDRMKRDIL